MREFDVKVKDFLFDFIYLNACRAATTRTELASCQKRVFYNDKCKALVYKFVDSVMCGIYISQNQYDSNFNACVEEMIRCFNGSIAFTFGNAQKIINITLKFLYINCYSSISLRDNFKFCHCPLDRKVKENAWIELKSLKKQEMEQSELKEYDGLLTPENRKILNQPWSKLESKNGQYELYQRIIVFLSGRRGIYPLEYDFMSWGTT